MEPKDLRELKTGDKVVFNPPFTVGREYAVVETSVGRLVYDDNGLGRFLLDICGYFNRKEGDGE